MRKVKVDASLLTQLRQTVERMRAAEESGDAWAAPRFFGAVTWLSEEMDRTSEEVPA